MTQNKRATSRLSYAHKEPELAKDNPLNGKTDKLTGTFEKERCPLHAKQLADVTSNDNDRDTEREAFKAMRRGQSQGSQMVRSHKPYPELKPSLELSGDVKAASHNSELAREHEHSNNDVKHRSKISEGQMIAGDLLQYLSSLDQAAQTAKEITEPTPGKKLEDVEREGFKLVRRMQERGDQVLSKSQAFRRSVGG